ncbi:Os05g0595100 [Oryza sativa Japonica Group]|jgi:nucleoside-diphosphate-sugar epimerase|uniref:UDP-glucose 4-epimerase n=1 Tax=Oryza sativa subsp. japonica TaxID=39947 RepID=A0A0N7KLC9_ORYSJ|nr:Os05g0595100 [Oryza sativa Japonica Group]
MVSALLRTILVTGGAGYIGSHTVLQLLQLGFRVVVLDNLDNASELAILRVRELAGHNANNLDFRKVFLPSFLPYLILSLSLSTLDSDFAVPFINLTKQNNHSHLDKRRAAIYHNLSF